MVIEMDVILNQEPSLVDRLWLVSPDALCLQYTEEVFGHPPADSDNEDNCSMLEISGTCHQNPCASGHTNSNGWGKYRRMSAKKLGIGPSRTPALDFGFLICVWFLSMLADLFTKRTFLSRSISSQVSANSSPRRIPQYIIIMAAWPIRCSYTLLNCHLPKLLWSHPLLQKVILSTFLCLAD